MPWACALLVLLADQWTKKAAQNRAYTSYSSALLRFRVLRHQERFYESNVARIVLVLLWLVALASSVVLARNGLWFHGDAARVGLGMALGGSAANLIDILWKRHIVDFIDLGWWPVFNLADVAIVAGLIMAFVL